MAYIGRSVDIGMFEKQVLTPDSSTTTFTLTFAVGSANSLLVVYGGVIQEPAVAYSVSGGGQSIVFSEAPLANHSLYVIYLGKQLTTPRAAGQETTKQTFTGDGTTTVFTLADAPVVPAGIMVFVDGILQREGSGNNFVSSGSTIAFSSAPDSGAEIDVYTLVKEKVSIDTVADGSITRAKLAASHPYWDASGKVGINTTAPKSLLHVATSNASDSPTLGTATGGMFITNANVFYGLHAGVQSTGNAWLQVTRNDANATSYNLNLQPAGGNVGVGTSSATSKLTISTTGADGIELTTDAGSGGGLSNRLFFTHAGGAGTGVAMVGANTRTEGAIRVFTGSTPGSSSGTQRIEISKTGIGIGVVSPADGIGIAFPASQSASSDPNTLDDYEEGTWTPTVGSSGGDAVVSVTSINSTWYTKIGNTVHFGAYITVSVTSVGTGILQLGGLPFVNKGGYTPFTNTHDNLSNSTGGGWVTPNVNRLEFLNAGSTGQLPIAGTGTRYCMVMGVYKTD